MMKRTEQSNLALAKNLRRHDGRLVAMSGWIAVAVVLLVGAGIVFVTVRQHTMNTEQINAYSLITGGILCVGVVLLVLLQVKIKRFFRPACVLGYVLDQVQQGERDVDTLLVSEKFGPMAIGWNMLLKEYQAECQRNHTAAIAQAIQHSKNDSMCLTDACHTLTRGMVVLDDQFQVQYCNGAACMLLHAEKETIYETPFIETVANETICDAVRDVFEHAEQNRVTLEIGDVKHIDANGAILNVCITRFEHNDGLYAIITIDDVTQLRLAQESQSAFIAQATHELRTPLTSIRLYAEEAIEADADNTIREKALNVINSESRRLERIVSDMLCVSEIEAGSLSIRPDTVRTEQMFEELAQDYQTLAEDKSITLSFDLPPKFPTIHADRDRLGQALHNLIGNALKYTPSGGKVDVRASFDDGKMCVQVKDTGIGIDESQLERIFDRFCRAEDKRIAHVTGSGIGLSLARQIARLHGGDVTVESVIDQGSVFTLSIPIATEASKAA